MREYLRRSRSAWYSFVFVLPLLVLYQIGVVVTNLGHQAVIVNGADALLRAALHGIGIGGWFTSAWFLALLAGMWIYRSDPSAPPAQLEPRIFLAMLAESVLYALLFGGVVANIVRALMPWVNPGLRLGPELGFGRSLTLSLGAGIYEELVFRVLGMGGFYWLLRRGFSLQETPAWISAAFLSSLVFSLFHYVGPLGDMFRLSSFMFRFVAGMVLAALFRLRGFGIAAGTHALYDVFVVLARV